MNSFPKNWTKSTWSYRKILQNKNSRAPAQSFLLISYAFYYISISSKFQLKFSSSSKSTPSFLFLWATKNSHIFYLPSPWTSTYIRCRYYQFFVCSICIILPYSLCRCCFIRNLLNSLKRNLIKIQKSCVFREKEQEKIREVWELIELIILKFMTQIFYWGW